jgi:transcriptional regulator with XRE-family HTH domain
MPRRPERLWRELVGEQLRAVRSARGETLRDVASSARVSPQYLSEIERGLKEPSSEILAAIGESLDTTLLDLTAGVAQRLTDTRSTAKSAFTLAA